MNKIITVLLVVLITYTNSHAYTMTESQINSYTNIGKIEYKGYEIESPLYSHENYTNYELYGDLLEYKVTKEDKALGIKIDSIFSNMSKNSKGIDNMYSIKEKTSNLLTSHHDGEIYLEDQMHYLIYMLTDIINLYLSIRDVEGTIDEIDNKYKKYSHNAYFKSICIDGLYLIGDDCKIAFEDMEKNKKITKGMTSTSFHSINHKDDLGYELKIKSEVGNQYCLEGTGYQKCLWLYNGEVHDVTEIFY